LSRLYQEGGNPKKATTVLQSWLKYHPDDLVVGANLALTLQQRGLNDQAITAYERVYQINPNNVIVLNNLAWLYFQKGDPRALELGAKAYELAPQRPEVVDTYGWILLSSGNSEKALVILQEALVSAPDNSEITYHVAVAMDKVGRRDEARKLLSRLFKGNPSFSEVDKAKDLLKRLGG
jgi:Flp pilus assembly protein TadD